MLKVAWKGYGGAVTAVIVVGVVMKALAIPMATSMMGMVAMGPLALPVMVVFFKYTSNLNIYPFSHLEEHK